MRVKSLKSSLKTFLYLKLIFLIIISVFTRCASIQEPKGGPKDSIAPKVIKETPANLTRNFKAKKIQIQFNEFVKLSNEFKEISVSPEMERPPIFKGRKNVLEITLQDTLEKNTTYSINFGKGVVDVNEGNVLKNYSYVFATGNIIDSLTITGKVINTLTKKPELDATVFIIPTRQDSIFGKRRASIFTTTDSSGNYILRNLRQDTYRIYAIKEEGGDRIYNNPKEAIAFKRDSIFLNSNITGVNMELFIAEPATFRIVDRKIEPDGRMLFTFNKGLTKPSIQISQPAALNDRKIVEFSKAADTAMIWLRDMAFDSVTVVPKDGNVNLDTVVLRRNRRDDLKQVINVGDNLTSGRLKPGNDLVLTFSAPVSAFDVNKIKFLEDSVAKGAEIIKDTTSARRYIFKYRWRTKRDYILDLGEAAFSNDFGGKSKAAIKRLTLDEEENYGNLILDVKIPDTTRSYVVQLLRNEGEILRTDVIKKNGKITYTRYGTGAYAVRVIYDNNNNGKWDTGNVLQRIQPEQIWNFDKELTLRANWDLEEVMTIPPPPPPL